MDCKEMALSDNFYNYITDFPLEVNNNFTEMSCFTDIDNTYSVVYMNRSETPGLGVGRYQYQSIPKLYGLMQTRFDPTSLIASGITQTQGQPLNLVGRGCVICLIDTGIDYQSPVFRDENGNSRILAIWDQTIQTGAPPEGFLFGTEYKREEINRALQAAEPYEIVPSRDENGHGTAMAAVAAGSNVAGNLPYRGAAPGADIVVVKLKECKPYLREYYLIPEGIPAYQEDDIMLAVKYADSFVSLFEQPVIICLGLGTNMGDHAGNSALSEYLNSVAVKRSRGVVVCGGNEGNAGHHYQGELETSGGGDVDAVEVRVGDGSRGFILEIWGEQPDVINVSLRSPGGETVPPTRLATDQRVTYGFVYERTRVTIETTLVEPASGEQQVIFRLQDPTPGIWTFTVEAVSEINNGTFHMWLPITEFLDTEVYFLNPTPYVTLTEPAMAADVISVSTYNAENNGFYIESGRGYSRLDTIRPDIAAPGVNVATPDGVRTGSSMAAAITAGAVAQLMQWAVVEQNNQYVGSREIKGYLVRGAARQNDLEYPNREWGYGRLDVVGVFEAVARV